MRVKGEKSQTDADNDALKRKIASLEQRNRLAENSMREEFQAEVAKFEDRARTMSEKQVNIVPNDQ